MPNIEESVVRNIKENSLSLYETLNLADKWVNKNLRYENKEKVSLEVKHARRVIRKINNSIDYKPVFALFGVSQVGKSYLVKNLLSLNGQALEIKLGNEKYDFLKDINPEGSGAESTGVVTRFSTECKLVDANYPVKIRLLSIKDIVIILCDSFFTDIRSMANYPSEEDFSELGNKLQLEYKEQSNAVSYLNEDDILEIQDYFERNFYKNNYITERINKSGYWLKLASVSGKLSSNEFLKAFSILWNNYCLFNELFVDLIKKLDEIKFPKHVYAQAESVLRTHGDILNVQRVKELNTSNNIIGIIDNDLNKYDINISYLSALSEEITLTISKELEKEKPFLINTDLLDFPGARSRLENSIESVGESATPQMFLRGKVAYLFNRYSADYEINNLLFCQNDAQTNVKEIPTMLYEWIANNVGRTSSEREKNLKKLPVSPLFIVFTFINNQMRYDSTNDDNKDLNYKWNNRFNRFFEEELITSNYNWHIDWSTEDPLFKNFYFLRDFKYSTDTFEGFETEKRELNINPNRLQYLSKLKDSFIKHPFVAKHMPDGEEIWDQISQPNEDGSIRILHNLMPAANNAIKIQNYVQIINDKLQIIKSKLEPNFQSDNIHEKRQFALNKGNSLQLELNRIIGKNPKSFGDLLKTFMVDEVEVFIYIHENLIAAQVVDNFDEYVLFRAQFPELNPSYTIDQNVDILRNKLGYNNTDSVLQFLNDNAIDLNKLFNRDQNSTASVLIDGLFNKWESEINFNNNSNVNSAVFDDIFDVLKSTIKQLEFKMYVQKEFEKKINGIQINHSIEENLAAFFCYSFNEFVCNIGFNFIDRKDLIEIGESIPSLKGNIQNLINPASTQIGLSLNDLFNHSASVSDEMEYNPMVESYINYIIKIKIALLLNCGFVNYDVEANAELGSIINQLNTIHSTLN